MPSSTPLVIAVAAADLHTFGCPHCGHHAGFMPISDGRTTAWICGSCDRQTYVLAAGVTCSTLRCGDRYPELQPHPRRPPVITPPYAYGGG